MAGKAVAILSKISNIITRNINADGHFSLVVCNIGTHSEAALKSGFLCHVVYFQCSRETACNTF